MRGVCQPPHGLFLSSADAGTTRRQPSSLLFVRSRSAISSRAAHHRVLSDSQTSPSGQFGADKPVLTGLCPDRSGSPHAFARKSCSPSQSSQHVGTTSEVLAMRPTSRSRLGFDAIPWRWDKTRNASGDRALQPDPGSSQKGANGPDEV
jgi:hypothetical protein